MLAVELCRLFSPPTKDVEFTKINYMIESDNAIPSPESKVAPSLRRGELFRGELASAKSSRRLLFRFGAENM